MLIRILGRTWELRFVSNLGCRGDCDPPEKKHKEIRILSSLKGEEKLEVIIHEMTHAAGWHILDEHFVDRFAKDVARAVWRLGYRNGEK